jgi:hypothetical protein
MTNNKNKRLSKKNKSQNDLLVPIVNSHRMTKILNFIQCQIKKENCNDFFFLMIKKIPSYFQQFFLFYKFKII